MVLKAETMRLMIPPASASIETPAITFRNVPVGCTCHHLWPLPQYGIEFPKIAGLMLSAILSDTAVPLPYLKARYWCW